jgi:hypothetical protein
MIYLKKLEKLIEKQKGTVLSADLDLYRISERVGG